MSTAADAWYVRLPDGRVYWAPNTTAVRQQLGAGKLPRDCRVRRSPNDEWVGLEWTEEFADLLHTQPADGGPPTPVPARRNRRRRPAPVDAGGVASHLDPHRLRTVGFRGLLVELLAALDSTLVLRKLLVAAAVCAAGGVMAALFVVARPWNDMPGEVFVPAVAGIVLVAAVLSNALLTRLTYVELSRLRPARWGDGTTGLARPALRLLAAYLIAGAVPVVLLVLTRRLPYRLLEGDGAPEAAGAAAVLGMVLQLLLWPLVAFTLLLSPIFLIEDCGVLAGLRQWRQLVRGQTARLFLFESLALVLGCAASLVLSLPVLLAILGAPADGPLAAPTRFAAYVLGALALAPCLCYLSVANVFIYLNLRYESGRH